MVVEPGVTQKKKGRNGSGEIEKLEKYYKLAKSTIMEYQSADLGLFTRIGGKGSYGHIRDNVYCSMCLWAMSLAFRYLDDTTGRAYELEHSAIKCMRAILSCLMQQIEELEIFKARNDSSTCLSCMFEVSSGKPMPVEECNHLQVDALALYILTLCQMIASGSMLIYTRDEVSFVQNLVFSIERAYRTTDYGMWEEGSRYFHTKELNSSSIGMAKAALEAANGLNLFGLNGVKWSVLYSDPDAHFRNTQILQKFLPRESFSKEVDASLITIVGFPAFSVDSNKKRCATLSLIEEKLKGEYGYKRFPLDSFGVPKDIHDPKNSALTSLCGIESEWPIFYAFLAINAIFSGNENKLDEYKSVIKRLIVKSDTGLNILPMFYHVASSSSSHEASGDKSCLLHHQRARYPSSNQVFLWGQSVYIIYLLLKRNLVKLSGIDPLQRFKLRRDNFRPFNLSSRYSSYQVHLKRAVVQICLLSETSGLQTTLATYGVTTQNLTEISPAIVYHPSNMTTLFSMLGKNERLKLSGRPLRPTGQLFACKLYRALGNIVITYPLSLDDKNFYISNDISMMIDDIKTKIKILSKVWNMHGRPTLFLLLKPSHFTEARFVEMMKFLYDLKTGSISDTKVKLGNFQSLLNTACIEYLDFLPEDYNLLQHSIVTVSRTPSQQSYSSRAVRLASTIDSLTNSSDRPIKIKKQTQLDLTSDFRDTVKYSEPFNEQMFLTLLQEGGGLHHKLLILRSFVETYGLKHSISLLQRKSDKWTVKDEIEACFDEACAIDDWSSIRFAAGLLERFIDSLAPSVTALVVAGKILVLGSCQAPEYVIRDPISPQEIYTKLKDILLPIDPREFCLQQELIINLANFITTSSKLFVNLSKIHIGWIILAMKSLLSWCRPTEDISSSHSLESSSYSYLPCASGIYSLSPFQIKDLLQIALSENPHFFHGNHIPPLTVSQKRLINGTLCKVPPNFFPMVWKILENSAKGLQIYDAILPKFPTIIVMTSDEINFYVLVEAALSGAKTPQRRELCIEMIIVIASLLERNPEVEFDSYISISSLLNDAETLYKNRLISPYSTGVNVALPNSGSESIQSQSEPEFETLPSSLNGGTAYYMMHAAVKKFLNDGKFGKNAKEGCLIS